MDDDLILNIATDDGLSSRGAGKKGGRWTDRYCLVCSNISHFLLSSFTE